MQASTLQPDGEDGRVLLTIIDTAILQVSQPAQLPQLPNCQTSQLPNCPPLAGHHLAAHPRHTGHLGLVTTQLPNYPTASCCTPSCCPPSTHRAFSVPARLSCPTPQLPNHPTAHPPSYCTASSLCSSSFTVSVKRITVSRLLLWGLLGPAWSWHVAALSQLPACLALCLTAQPPNHLPALQAEFHLCCPPSTLSASPPHLPTPTHALLPLGDGGDARHGGPTPLRAAAQLH